MISHKRLMDILTFDPSTGVFRWTIDRVGRNNSPVARAGDVPGRLCYNGYWQMGIDSKVYYAHRLAWFYVYGIWPKNEIDHINGERNDNRICNLREATRSQNFANRKPNVKRKLPKGVTIHKASGLFMVQISKNNKRIHAKYFKTVEDAAKDYKKVSYEIFGEFARAV